jgi:hypothetical protein
MARPAGDRWVLMFLYVNDLADNPADRCLVRTATTTTTYVWKYTTTGTGKKKRMTATLVPVTTTTYTDTLTNQRGPWSLAQISPSTAFRLDSYSSREINPESSNLFSSANRSLRVGAAGIRACEGLCNCEAGLAM